MEKVDFVTTRGNIDRIVTPLCVFRYDGRRLCLDTVHPGVSAELLQENTGFPLDMSQMRRTPLPTEEELRKLRLIDPKDYRNIEFL